jgi:hypothetical protein
MAAPSPLEQQDLTSPRPCERREILRGSSDCREKDVHFGRIKSGLNAPYAPARTRTNCCNGSIRPIKTGGLHAFY